MPFQMHFLVLTSVKVIFDTWPFNFYLDLANIQENSFASFYIFHNKIFFELAIYDLAQATRDLHIIKIKDLNVDV